MQSWDPWGERNEEQKFSDMALWMRRWRCDGITFNFYTGLPHIFPHPLIHTCPFIAQERLDSMILKEHHVTRRLLIWVNPWFYPTLVIILSHLPSPCTMLKVKFVQQLWNKPVPNYIISLILKRKPGNEAKPWVVLQSVHKDSIIKIHIQFPGACWDCYQLQCHPLGWGCFNATHVQFSRQDNKHSRYMMKGFRLSIAQQHFQSCDLMWTYYYPSMLYSTARSGSPLVSEPDPRTQRRSLLTGFLCNNWRCWLGASMHVLN